MVQVILNEQMTESDVRAVLSYENDWTHVDVFCGCGGMSLGLEQAGFRCGLAIDNDDKLGVDCRNTWAHNMPLVPFLSGDVREMETNELIEKWHENEDEAPTIVVGGPPCQGYSTAGKRDEKDERNFLFYEFARVVNAFRPKAFVMENVTGLLSMKGPSGKRGEFVDLINHEMTDYRVYPTPEEVEGNDDFYVYDARNYGVPQRRHRVFFVGIRRDIHARGARWSKPEPTHDESEWLTVRDACEDLIGMARDESINHVWTNKSRSSIINGMRGSYGQGRKVVPIDEPSPTVTSGNHGNSIGVVPAVYHVPPHFPWKEEDRQLYGDEMLEFFRDERPDITDDDAAAFVKDVLDAERVIAYTDVLNDGELSIDAASATIRQIPFKWLVEPLRYKENGRPDFSFPNYYRVFSVRECARLQGFPDDFFFVSNSRGRQYHMVGNAVPPPLARVIGTQLKRTLEV